MTAATHSAFRDLLDDEQITKLADGKTVQVTVADQVVLWVWLAGGTVMWSAQPPDTLLDRVDQVLEAWECSGDAAGPTVRARQQRTTPAPLPDPDYYPF